MNTIEAMATAEEAGFGAALLEALPVGVVVQTADTGAIVYANDAACEILGLTRDQMVGRDSMDPRWQAVDADGVELPGDRHPAMQTVRTRRPTRGIMGVRRPAHDLRWIDVTARLLERAEGSEDAPDVVFATFVDVTHARALEDEAASVRRRLELLLGQTSDLLFVADPDGTISYASPPVADLFGRGGPGSVGTSLFGLPVVDGAGSLADVVADVVGRPGGRSTHRVPLAVGASDGHWFEARARNCVDDPEVGGVVVTLIDVDAQVRSEAALRTANRDLESQIAALDALRRVDRLLTDAGVLLRRSRSVHEAEAVLWDCARGVFDGAEVALYGGGADDRFLGHRFGQHDGATPPADLETDACWALRTGRIHANDSTSSVRCAHFTDDDDGDGDGAGLCVPLRLGANRVLVTVTGIDEAAVPVWRRSAEAMIDRLGGAVNAVTLD